MRPVICPALVQPECRKDLLRLVKDEQGCCDIWQCDCQCELYGDPHYISFSGTTFDFLDNCTYTLVKEKNPRHHFSISVDNYYSSPWLFGSSVKGVILKYGEATATLQLNPNSYAVEATLDGVPVQPPYEKHGISFESTNFTVSMYINKIRSYISFNQYKRLQITLAREHFQNNTMGQCGVCGGPSCIRRNGQVESDDCCSKTAYDWIEEDPLKPYCNDAPKNISCAPGITPVPSLHVPHPNCTVCGLLRHELFRNCSQGIDLETLERNCELDCLVVGNITICSSLQQLSEQCKRQGYCVYWRNLTQGVCDVTCPEGMIFDECRSAPDDVCQGGIRVPGKFSTDNMRSGCFCPDNKSLAESHKTFCVSECTNCKGPLGEPMPAGAVCGSQTAISMPQVNNQISLSRWLAHHTMPSSAHPPSQMWIVGSKEGSAAEGVVVAGQFCSVSRAEPNVCKTYGSGIINPFSKNLFYLKTTCPITLTRFTLLGVNCDVTVQRGSNGLMTRVEILVNKVSTVLQDGKVIVEGNSVSLPFDHMYQLVYEYGIYIKFRSKVLPFTVTWRSHSDGISSLWVQLDHDLVKGMNGMCDRKTNESLMDFVPGNIINDRTCITADFISQNPPKRSEVCGVLSYVIRCPGMYGVMAQTYEKYCHLNMYETTNKYAKCAYFEEFARLCGNQPELWPGWRQKTSCEQPTCPGDLKYQELGPPFPPTCTNRQPPSDTLTNTCLPPQGMVLNDRAKGYQCISVKDCPCVHGGKTYPAGAERNTKCQSCACVQGKWTCSDNICPPTCNIEGQFVTTFDGKQYSVPGKCTYVAALGLSWQVAIKFSDTDASIAEMHLQVNQDKYTFSKNSVKLGQDEITDLSQTEYATVFWQSSMFVRVQTSFGLKIKVQVSPEIQLYLYLPPTEKTTGLCGTHNNNTEDDFTTSSGIVENAVRPFAQSWTVGDCSPPDSSVCINTDNGIYAEDKCSLLTNTSSVFARCHYYVPVSTFVEACVHRTCQCTSGLKNCLCVALSNYAKACASQGIDVGDWRAETDCKISCNGNLRFSYNTVACNQTCRSLTSHDPICDMEVDSVEGCGCLPGTHLNTQEECSPRAFCSCYYQGGTTPPGPVVIDGRDCMCENGNLSCSAACDCPRGKICVHCAHSTVNTAQKTCGSLNKRFVSILVSSAIYTILLLLYFHPLKVWERQHPSKMLSIVLNEYQLCLLMAVWNFLSLQSVEENCTNGCYCPPGLFENHNGTCVAREDCTCEFSDKVYASGQSVETNCETCVQELNHGLLHSVCRGGQWDCEEKPCEGVCEVFGNGQYKTFDSKWYRFDGHCQYTLVEDATSHGHNWFAVRVESVPCCDEFLTCSRAISVDLKVPKSLPGSSDEVTLILRDMNVTQTLKAGWQPQSLYSVHTLGLHIIISVPDLGLTVIWDKHTRVKIILQASWKGKVHGLCGNFDGKVMNDLLTSSSSVVSSPLEFGNSWKTAVPPCSDVTKEVFPCQRHSYCEAWAQRRCMILQSDTFSDCHLKVDPAPFYQACILESCSCEFEGRFLGFCTAVAAYAEACTTQNVCINWRTPDLCRMYLLTLASFSVYCDYYNEGSECGWHYDPCGQMKTCGKKHSFTGRLEGCYPRCPPEMPYFDENTRKCSSLDNCTCDFNSTTNF
ncbi:hypothetical protein NFI96_013758 [Prochilodus magdalenae]|nr:hypothetical protein NFI96_013758 [Prochilodus magdalenae]